VEYDRFRSDTALAIQNPHRPITTRYEQGWDSSTDQPQGPLAVYREKPPRYTRTHPSGQPGKNARCERREPKRPSFQPGYRIWKTFIASLEGNCRCRPLDALVYVIGMNCEVSTGSAKRFAQTAPVIREPEKSTYPVATYRHSMWKREATANFLTTITGDISAIWMTSSRLRGEVVGI